MAMAQVDAPAGVWTDEEFLANARRVLKTLMVWRGMEVEELAERSNMKRSTLYSRLREEDKTGFKGVELDRLARALGARPTVFFENAESLMGRESMIRWSVDSPALELVMNPNPCQPALPGFGPVAPFRVVDGDGS